MPGETEEEPHAASGNVEDILTPEPGATQAEPSQTAPLEQKEGTHVEQEQTATQEQNTERLDLFGLNKAEDMTPEQKAPEKPCTPTARRSRKPAVSPMPDNSSASTMPQKNDTSQQPATPTTKRRKLPDSFIHSPPAKTPTPKKKKLKKTATPNKGNNQIAGQEPDTIKQAITEPAVKKPKLEEQKSIPMKELRPV
jgi:hypothetical protein